MGFADDMNLDKKVEHKGEELKGKAKEATGRGIDDPELEAEGKSDQVSARLKRAGEKIKDAVRSVFKRR